MEARRVRVVSGHYRAVGQDDSDSPAPWLLIRRRSASSNIRRAPSESCPSNLAGSDREVPLDRSLFCAPAVLRLSSKLSIRRTGSDREVVSLKIFYERR